MVNNTKDINHSRNGAIDLSRLIAALIIVSCHTHVGRDLNTNFYYFFSRYMIRGAIAFFFSVSGYYYIGALRNGKNIFKKQLMSLIKVYTLWSLVYSFFSFILLVIVEKRNLIQYLWERIHYFFFEGSYDHFWYFPALIYSIIIITIAEKIGGLRGVKVIAILGIFLNFTGAFSGVYDFIGMKLPILSDLIESPKRFNIRGIFMVALPSVSIGYWIHEINEKVNLHPKKVFKVLFLLSIVAYFLEITYCVFVLKKFENYETMITTYFFAGSCILFLQINPFKNLKGDFETYKKLSSFIYYSHPLVILGLEMIAKILVFTWSTFLMFLITTVVTVSVGLYGIKGRSNYIKKFI